MLKYDTRLWYIPNTTVKEKMYSHYRYLANGQHQVTSHSFFYLVNLFNHIGYAELHRLFLHSIYEVVYLGMGNGI